MTLPVGLWIDPHDLRSLDDDGGVAKDAAFAVENRARPDDDGVLLSERGGRGQQQRRERESCEFRHVEVSCQELSFTPRRTKRPSKIAEGRPSELPTAVTSLVDTFEFKTL